MHMPLTSPNHFNSDARTPDRLELGVCYYPEQWPRGKWAEDARRMVELGLSWVRIGEFAWAKIEPRSGEFHWEWLDEAIDVLGKAGLKVILGTPTAAPPKWLVNRYPEILPVDATGAVRKFGARRHYCFSSRRYRSEAARITEAMARRYGEHIYVHAWQTDNEYGDHDTIYSYSAEAVGAFRLWLAERYGSIDELNRAWGTSFWSMRYDSFEEIDLPNNLVEEPSPTHGVDFIRFSSDQVKSFNKAQVDIIRAHSPGRPVTHNFMSQNTDFDHYRVGEDIDIASWDVYPMGGLLNGRLAAKDKEHYLRVGDPDQPAFNHDLYRAVGRGRVWVMEQQPGPVNWAAHNQSPADGMVRLWTWLAYAHGVDMVSYFRWRQAPFAQEQFHAGLLLPNSEADQGYLEVAEVVAEMKRLPEGEVRGKAQVAIVLDYESRWATRVLPQGRSYSASAVALDWYSTAARLGVDVDFIGQHSDLDGYNLILAPDLVIAEEAFVERLARADAKVVFGARSGSKTRDMHIPEGLPPGPLAKLIDVSVSRVESLPEFHSETVLYGNEAYEAGGWRETVRTNETVLASFDGEYRNGTPALVGNDKARYLAVAANGALLDKVIGDALGWAGLESLPDLGDLRVTRRGNLRFAFNFGRIPAEVPAGASAEFYVGGRTLKPVDVAIWRE
ncbi:beta-galactosidase (plasmid) [Sinorhizobium meliloti WSM1022]|uniref:beta-galactosidase n=1 Tax=Rhizobium meliloti TaxID=382 RepID=UPI0002A572C4|nr:beta-galactosidase [Sinorhizobium meliloti]AGA10614.1 Beta-galactosidase [Sinorhizobium meliloti GR4]MCK3786889.1 beta-galactosidase [Sinorhizobium meliloti]MCK3793173.1 beta-galactosidase [Sinorhizobium meliloti]MCK3798946.1 beta-galactosidase [Sinorhizobium meliloti]MCM5688069.1 beta-galactosidase [Sinorhizobium meliloti]